PRMPASSNMPALSLPNTARSLSSATMVRLSLGSCRLWALMYSHIFLTASGRATGSLPMTAASCGLGALPAAALRGALAAAVLVAGAFLAAAGFAAFLAAALALLAPEAPVFVAAP